MFKAWIGMYSIAAVKSCDHVEKRHRQVKVSMDQMKWFPLSCGFSWNHTCPYQRPLGIYSPLLLVGQVGCQVCPFCLPVSARKCSVTPPKAICCQLSHRRVLYLVETLWFSKSQNRCTAYTTQLLSSCNLLFCRQQIRKWSLTRLISFTWWDP